MKIYQIGGSVRDKLMHRTPHDIDYVVVGSSPEEMLAQGYKQVGKQFPVFINPHDGCEYALARKEIKTGPKHTDFKFIFDASVSLAEDMKRRDFTCNAIALNMETDTIIDHNNGIADIKNKILRHVNSEHFVEDPLRILRLCRFAAQLNFSPAPETLELAKQMVNEGQLQYLSAERIWQEIFKALRTTDFMSFISVAKQCGALQAILPEVDNNLPQILANIQRLSSKSERVKFAVLLHNTNAINTICRRLKVPNVFRHFAIICAQNYTKLFAIDQMEASDIVDFADKFSGKNYTTISDFIDFCHTIATKNNALRLADNAHLLKSATAILNNIKASDMPDFATLPKDKQLQNHFRQYKINLLQQKILTK